MAASLVLLCGFDGMGWDSVVCVGVGGAEASMRGSQQGGDSGRCSTALLMRSLEGPSRRPLWLLRGSFTSCEHACERARMCGRECGRVR